jgi:hypothetical protein
MGDTGSLGLGGAVAALSVLLRIPLWLPIFGGVYMAESISVILQVGSFKLRGKRVFKMAPLHHHFELTGMPETRVVAMFMIAAATFVPVCTFKYLGGHEKWTGIENRIGRSAWPAAAFQLPGFCCIGWATRVIINDSSKVTAEVMSAAKS